MILLFLLVNVFKIISCKFAADIYIITYFAR